MSRRFGRNQRRRAREALAAAQVRIDDLERAHVMDLWLLTYQSKIIADQRKWLDLVVNEVGRQAVLAGEPTDLPMGRDGMQVIPPSMPLPDFRDGAILPQAFLTEVLRLLDVEVIRDRLSRQMHVYVTLADGRVTYGMTESAIRGLSEDALLRLIVPRLAEQLVTELRRTT